MSASVPQQTFPSSLSRSLATAREVSHKQMMIDHEGVPSRKLIFGKIGNASERARDRTRAALQPSDSGDVDGREVVVRFASNNKKRACGQTSATSPAHNNA